jgi:preprotein translocase subunit SecE
VTTAILAILAVLAIAALVVYFLDQAMGWGVVTGLLG